MLSDAGKRKLKTLIMNHEGFADYPYFCPAGYLTIGYGHNLDAKKMSKALGLAWLEEDLEYFLNNLPTQLPAINTLNEDRKIALIDMCYNLGIKGLLSFKDLIACLNEKNYSRAADEMLDSKWSKQVGKRAKTLANIMRTGIAEV